MTMKNLLISEKYVFTSAKHCLLPKIHALTGCNATSYFYQVGEFKVLKKLLGQQDLCFI